MTQKYCILLFSWIGNWLEFILDEFLKIRFHFCRRNIEMDLLCVVATKKGGYL